MGPVHYKIGTNFDMQLIDVVADLNRKHGSQSKVAEFYGSIASDHELAARPQFRLPDKSVEELAEFTQAARSIGASVNYTLNSIMPYGSKGRLVEHTYSIMKWLEELEKIGVELITVSSPMLLELIKNNGGPGNLKIEVSTIAHVDTLTQIKYYHDAYGVSKICGNLLKNRDFEFIRKAVNLCNSLGMQYELMANEFCGVGTSEYATHCIYRDSCYICHALNKSHTEAQLMSNYPMDMCTAGRNANKANWLRSNFIRPEDIAIYNVMTQCDRFKITGRTGSVALQMKLIEAYMSRSFDGDLLELWKPLETIQGTNTTDTVGYKTVPNKALEGFIEHWVRGNTCYNEVCGVTCNYCQKWYDNIVREGVD